MPSNTILVKTRVEGNKTIIRMLIHHPMDTGRVRSKKTGKLIPAHFIKTVTCEVNGKNVFTADWSVSVAKDPYMMFVLKGAHSGDTLKIHWVDNKGESDTKETKIS